MYPFRSFCLFFLLTIGQSLSAQIDLSDHFNDLLEAADMEFLEPVEARYKAIRIGKNLFQSYDFAIRSRKEKIEIRYLIEPYDEKNPIADIPHLASIRLLTHLASNSEEAGVITGLDIEAKKLKTDFNADWGKTFFFKTKNSFSTKSHCKMLALFREGRGMAYVFFLFDKVTEDLDRRFLALRFKDEVHPR